MRLRRSSEGPTPTSETGPTTAAAWDGIPARAAGEPVIKAPRAAEAAAPLRAA
jgi:hypothetical protein